jgi:hypothetical protein
MNTIRKSKVITGDYTLELYDYGKIFVNTDNDVTITLPTPDNDLDVYVKNLGTGTTTVNKVNGAPTATRANRKIDGDNSVTISENVCLLISYVKDLDKFLVI